MRVRHLQTYLNSQRLPTSGRTESLRGLTLGLDAASWARGLLELKDPFAELMGGLPLCVNAVIDRQLTRLAEFEVFPYFFFQGLTPNGHSLFTKIDSRAISEAWTLLLDQNVAAAHAKFGRIASRLTGELICHLARYLRARAFVADPAGRLQGRTVRVQRRLAVFQCPYLSSAQMAHLVRCHMLDAVYGITSFVLVGLPRVIINLDFERGTFEWVEKEHLLVTWDVSESQLIDACVVAGTEYCHTLPHLNILSPKQFSFQTAIELAKTSPLENLMTFFPDEKIRHAFRHLYSLTRALFTFLVAIQGHGHVAALTPAPIPVETDITHLLSQNEPDNTKDAAAAEVIKRMELRCATSTTIAHVPYDLRAVKGWRLPNSLFLLLLEGIVSPTLLKVLAYGEWRDFDTLIVLPQQYETCLVQSRAHRLLALGLIARHLHPSFVRRRIVFEYISRHCDDPVVLLPTMNSSMSAQYAPTIKPMLPWSLDMKIIEELLQTQNIETPSPLFCLRWHIHSMSRHFTEELAALDVHVARPLPPVIGGERTDLLDFNLVDVAHIERTARKHLALGNRRRGLAPAQNWLMSLVIFTFLESLGYFEAQGAPTALGHLLISHCHTDFEEEMLIALELLKLGLLHGQEFTYDKQNDYPAALTDPPVAQIREVSLRAAAIGRKWNTKIPPNALDAQQVQISIRLISRAVSLVPVGLDAHVTSCPGHFLDFDIAAYLALVKHIKSTLNLLIEACMANYALERPTYARLLTPDIFDPRAPRMLWFKPVLGLGGVLLKAVLMTVHREDTATTIASLPSVFPEIADFWGSILILCEFWAQLSKIVCGLKSDDLTNTFACADTLLCLQMWELLPHLNPQPQQCPAFCELLEKSLGVDFSVKSNRYVPPHT